MGDHVSVVSGKHEGSKGMVIRVDRGEGAEGAAGAIAILLSDVLKEELKVFMRDLAGAGEGSTSADVLGEYSLHDLVGLEQSVTGMIVKVERSCALVLTHNGAPAGPPPAEQLPPCFARLRGAARPGPRASPCSPLSGATFSATLLIFCPPGRTGTPDRPDIRTCRLPDLKRRIVATQARGFCCAGRVLGVACFDVLSWTTRKRNKSLKPQPPLTASRHNALAPPGAEPGSRPCRRRLRTSTTTVCRLAASSKSWTGL